MILRFVRPRKFPWLLCRGHKTFKDIPEVVPPEIPKFREESSSHQKWKSMPVFKKRAMLWTLGCLITCSSYISYTHSVFLEDVHRNEEKNGIKLTGSFRWTLFKTLDCTNGLSSFMGSLAHIEFPEYLRVKFLEWYIARHEIDMTDVIEQDLTKYPTVSSFFLRDIDIEGRRPIDKVAPLVAPVDGIVLHCGVLDNPNHLHQVKDVKFTCDAFFGSDGLKTPSPGNSLYQCVIYLDPRDYHYFHSPTEWQVSLRRHFSGFLLNSSPKVANWLQFLYAINERAVYFGTWKYGFFSYTPVGSIFTGSIKCDFDPDLKTNINGRSLGTCSETISFTQAKFERGQELGHFDMGSTVVLVFEAPKSFKFSVKDGQSVKLGEGLGKFA